MLSEVSQIEKETYDITCVWNLKKYNKLVNITLEKQTHRYREQSRVASGEGKFRGGRADGTNY